MRLTPPSKMQQSPSTNTKENYRSEKVKDSKAHPIHQFKYIEYVYVHHQNSQELPAGQMRKRAKLSYKPLGCLMSIRINFDAKTSQFKIVKLINEHIDASGTVKTKQATSNSCLKNAD